MNTIRVLMADSHPVTRAGLRAVLAARPDVLVVGEAGDGPEAVKQAAALDPDVVVAEAAMPGLAGAALVAALVGARPGRRVLVLAGSDGVGQARAVLAAGAAGYALKASCPAELLRALLAVAGGGAYLDPAVAGGVLSVVGWPGAEAGPAQPELSGREAGVVRLVALGYANKEIAVRLAVSVKTVETYKARSLEKLGGRSRVDLVRHAFARGWLAEDAPAPAARQAV